MSEQPTVITNLQSAQAKLHAMQRPAKRRGPSPQVAADRKRAAANAIKVVKLAKEQMQKQAKVD
jgi:hypothetical protein